MAQYKDITGNKYGRLTALRFSCRDNHKQAFWACMCDCGCVFVARLQSLTSGATKSCGCLNEEVRVSSMIGNKKAATHGLSEHPLYRTWSTIKQRCTNPKQVKYPHYGGRGISVCERWMNSFPDFLADMGEKPEGHTLSRKNNDGPYSPDNCEWQTHSEQNRNRRKYVRK